MRLIFLPITSAKIFETDHYISTIMSIHVWKYNLRDNVHKGNDLFSKTL